MGMCEMTWRMITLSTGRRLPFVGSGVADWSGKALGRGYMPGIELLLLHFNHISELRHTPDRYNRRRMEAHLVKTFTDLDSNYGE
jgi:hypothetical protein